MLNNKVFKNSKRAALSVEWSICIALAIAVLFFVLPIFYSNLEKVAEKNRLTNITDNSKKTEWVKYNRDYSNSSINVQTFAPSQVPVHVRA